jgi:hypothetical protein
VLAASVTGTCVHAQSLAPTGISHAVPIASLDGWSLCYTDDYATLNVPLAGILSACGGKHLLLGCAPVASSTLTIAAFAPRAAWSSGSRGCAAAGRAASCCPPAGRCRSATRR